MTSEVIYLGGLKTECTHLDSGNRIHTAAPKDNQGDGSAFSPTDLLATSLASCMLSIMGIVAARNEWEIAGAKAMVLKVMAADPRRVSRIEITFEINGQNLDSKARLMLENAALACPVAKSLHPDLEQIINFNWL
jgi:uncharacterized OsmC-like protein